MARPGSALDRAIHGSAAVSSGRGGLSTNSRAPGSALDRAIHGGGGGGASLAPVVAHAPEKKSGGGFLHGVTHYVGENIVKNVGEKALGIGPGIVHLGALEVAAIKKSGGDPVRALGYFGQSVGKETGKSYAAYYGHDPIGHIKKDPVQFGLDVLTAADLGATAGVRAGVLSGERATIVTRSPRAAATGKGPVAKEVTSEKPLIRLRAQARAKARSAEGARIPGTQVRIGGEMKAYGKQIQSRTGQAALGRLSPVDAYHRATRRLSPDEWRALHIRAMDIHPDDLKTLWRGTANEGDLTPRAIELATKPSKRLAAAAAAARSFSESGAELLKGRGKLTEETAVARPDLTKRQAAEVLDRPVKQITGEPYYFPHTLEPQRAVSPLAAAGGGKGIPRVPGTTKQNLGVLALRGKLHLRSDVLGPEFLRRVKYVKYDEIHNALVRGAVRVTRAELDEHYGGKLPAGYEYVREKASTRVPATMRGEGETHTPIEKLIPNPEDLRSSKLSEGFSTTDEAQAHQTGGKFYIVPKSTVKAATGEFTRSGDFTHQFVHNPLKVWRSIVLGLRVGFLTNNLVGNSLMYAVKTGGQGALRDLFMSIKEQHGPEVAKKILDNAATPPELRRSLYDEFFPEQGAAGTFGMTQSPSTSAAGQAAGTVSRGFRTATGALPRLTSKVAEQAPRRALIRHYIRHSPEFKRVYQTLPKETRSFESAARQLLEGKGGTDYQRYISKRVNQALGDYLHLSPTERNVLRNTLPFYSWYKAIVTTTLHLAVDTPLRANILGQIGQIGRQWSDDKLGDVPSYLQGSIPLGKGPGGTTRVLGTQGLNPYATLEQLRRGATGDFSSLGLNPFLQGPLQQIQRGKTSPADIVGSAGTELVRGLPPARVAFPKKPSRIYPNRGRRLEGYGYFGATIKEFNPAVARQQARQGR